MSGTFEQKPVYIFSTSPFATFVAIVDDYATLRFKRGWYAPGDFEITINKNTLYASEFVKGRIIRVGEDNTKVGYIDDVTDEIGPTGAASEIRTIRGHELTQWFDRRDVLPPSGQAYYAPATTTKAETIIKNLVKDNFGSTAVASRQDADLTMVADSLRGPAYTLSSRYNNLLKELSDCLLATNTGMFVTLSPTTNKWIFDFGVGTDRTASVVFTTDRETTQSANLRESDIAYKNVAIVAGQGEGADRVVRTVWTGSEPTGRDRREMFVDARDLSLVASLDKRGEQRLAENQFTQYLKVDALAYSQIVFGVDYFVGDKVTVSQFGVSQEVYITTAEESWKAGFYGLSLGFDRSPPTLTGQVSGVAGTASQTLARVDPVWPSTTDGTLSANSDELIPTEKAVKTYADSLVGIAPPQDSLVLAITGEDVSAYPDGVAVIAQDIWTATTGWAGSTGNTLSIVGTKLRSTNSSGNYMGFGFTIGAQTNKHFVYKIVSSVAITTLHYWDGSAFQALKYTLSDAYTAIASMYISALGNAYIYVNNADTSTVYTVDLQYFYIGDGTYASKVIDSSKSNLRLTNNAVVPVPGLSGTALRFNDGLLSLASTAFQGSNGQEMSLSFMLFPRRVTGAFQMLFHSTQPGVGENWFVYLSATNGHLSIDGAANYESAYTPPINTWSHVVVRYSTPQRMQIIVDTVTVYDSGTYGFGFGLVSSTSFAIGAAFDTTLPSDCDMARPLFFKVALTDANGQWLYANKNNLANLSGVTAMRKNLPEPGSAVASVAGSITPTGDYFHVTGTAAITGITYDGKKQLTIIPDGVFTWTAAGNIALAGTAVVSKALIMTYDQGVSLWYPSYT